MKKDLIEWIRTNRIILIGASGYVLFGLYGLFTISNHITQEDAPLAVLIISMTFFSMALMTIYQIK